MAIEQGLLVRRGRAASCAFALTLAISSVGRAQPSPDATTPPRIVQEVSPAYPVGAHGDASVELELVVDASGEAREIKVVDGKAPFAARALAAVAGYAFAPALRDGKPIAARFRVRVAFREEVPPSPSPSPSHEPPPPAPPAPSTSTPEPLKAPDTGKPLEVVVEGERALSSSREATKTTLDARSLRRIPGAFGDAFRAIETLPGVVPFASGLPYFFVRGALPSSSGYSLDGVRIPFLFHVGAGPGVINPALVDKLEFFPGAYPAEYGHYLGGIVSATTPPPSQEARGEGMLRLFDAGGYIESPFLNGKASAFVGGRYSYTAAALRLAAPTLRLDYWDYQFGASYALDSKNRVGFFAFGSHDHLGKVDPSDSPEQELFGANFHRLQLKLDHGRGDPDAMRARLSIVFGVDESAVTDQGKIKSPLTSIRGDVDAPVKDGLRVRGGVQMDLDSFSFDPGPSASAEGFHGQVLDSFASRVRGTFGGYLDAVVRPAPWLELVPGARLDAYLETGSGGTPADPGPSVNGTREIDVDPRFAARIKLSSRVTSVTALGFARQWPTVLIPVPGLEPRGGAKGLQKVVSESQGLEVELPESVLATVTFFHNGFSDLTDLLATCSAKRDICNLSDRAGGRAYGLEARVARPLSKDVGGFVSYTLSRTERSFAGESFVSDLDRTHVLSAALGVRFLTHWHAGARVTAYSGRPYSLLAFDDPTLPTQIGKRNALRRPWFYRVDARVEREWRVGKSGWLAVIVEAMNVTLSKETLDFDCRVAQFNSDTTSLKCGGQEVGPVFIPSIGLAGGF